MVVYVYGFQLILSSILLKCVAGQHGGLYEYKQTVTLPANPGNAAEILAKPLTACAVTCLGTGDYLAEKTGSEECTCVGAGESLPQGTWNLFFPAGDYILIGVKFVKRNERYCDIRSYLK